jgi:hypothetical protein
MTITWRLQSADVFLIIYNKESNSGDPNYVDVIKVIPDMLGSSELMWSSLAGKCDLPQEVLFRSFPLAVSGSVNSPDPIQFLSFMPWKMLAVISDELVAGLRQAVRADFITTTPEQDPNRLAALSGLCLLECLFEHANRAGFNDAYTEAWIALFCDISVHAGATILPHVGLNPESLQPWTLEDIVFPWLQRRRLGTISKDSTCISSVTIPS